MSYTCDICNYSTEYKCDLDKHLTSLKHKRATTINVKCDNCENVFSSVMTLNKHKRSKKCAPKMYTEEEVQLKLKEVEQQVRSEMEDKLSSRSKSSSVNASRMVYNMTIDEYTKHLYGK